MKNAFLALQILSLTESWNIAERFDDLSADRKGVDRLSD
jgi:hypothetical protein